MKKGFVAISTAIALAASALIGTSMAGIGPGRGLPYVNLASLQAVSGADTYVMTATADNVPGVNGSIMCVACHTRNPAQRTAYNTNHSPGTYVGSHYVTKNFQDTAAGGGYTDGLNRRSAPIYMAGARTVTIGTDVNTSWFGTPKYGRYSASAPYIVASDNNPGTGTPQMICESCHNIVKNIGPAKLLAAAFANGAPTSSYLVNNSQNLQGFATLANGTNKPTLCIGCHGNMNATVSAEWQLHPVKVGGTAWSATHHHRNTGAATDGSDYFGSGTLPANYAGANWNMTVLNSNFYTNTSGLQLWGASYGELLRNVDGTARVAAGTNTNLTYDNAVNKKMRPAVTAAAQGQILVSSGTQVLCTNCHRAHNAATSGGGTILMVQAATPVINGISTTDNATYGMGRNTRGAHLKNTNAVCLACHQ